MKFAVVGAGVLGLTLAYRIAREGHEVEVLEAAPYIGGLVCAQDYGEFTWDRFYHCILPHDAHLIGLLRDLGIDGELRWTRTGTGYFADGRMYDMNGMADYLRFPLLSVVDKMRLGACVAYATRVADPWSLYGITAEAWLTRLCGRRGYQRFWQPLLRAKFGTWHDKVAAVFIWATLTRLAGASGGEAHRGSLGYVRGGYPFVLATLRAKLEALGVRIRVASPVTSVQAHGADCEIGWKDALGEGRGTYDKVLFTGPTKAAKASVAPDLRAVVERYEAAHPTARSYLGVVCLTLVLKKPLTPYYVLNIGDESVELTGLIEMTNLVSRDETAGRSLVYLPRYMDSEDSRFNDTDAEVRASMIDRGVRRLFRGFDDADIVTSVVSRARYVQPLPLVGSQPDRGRELPSWDKPFTLVNTALLQCATLNNNEVVGLADALMVRNLPVLRRGAAPSVTA